MIKNKALGIVLLLALALGGWLYLRERNVSTGNVSTFKITTEKYVDQAIAAIGEGTKDGVRQSAVAAPCRGDRDPDFSVGAVDHVTLLVERHRPILAALRQRFEADGWQTTRQRDFDSGGGDLVMVNKSDRWSITWTSSADGAWLSVLVGSPCVRPDDGKAPW